MHRRRSSLTARALRDEGRIRLRPHRGGLLNYDEHAGVKPFHTERSRNDRMEKARVLPEWKRRRTMIEVVNGSHQMPLGCTWLLLAKRSDALQVSNWTRAVCVRVPGAPRMVSQADCVGCKFWEPAETRSN